MKNLKVMQVVKSVRFSKFGVVAIHNGYLYLSTDYASVRIAIDCPEKTIAIVGTSAKQKINCLELLIESGRVGQFVQETESSDLENRWSGKMEYDGTPIVESGLQVEPQAIGLNSLESLQWIATACDDQSTRYQLGGVCLDAGDNCAVATDGRRLHGHCFGTWFGDLFGSEKKRILHRDSLKTLATIAKQSKQSFDCRVSEVGTYWTSSQVAVFCPFVLGRFPNWQAIVPKVDSVDYRGASFTTSVRDLAIKETKLAKLRQKTSTDDTTEETAWIRLDDSYAIVDGDYIVDALEGCLADSETCIAAIPTSKNPGAIIIGSTDYCFAIVMGGSPDRLDKLTETERQKTLSKYPTAKCFY